MIERENGRFVPTCDYCGVHLAPEAEKGAAIEATKAAGWTIIKQNEWYFDFCKECARHLGLERPRGHRPARQPHGRRSDRIIQR